MTEPAEPPTSQRPDEPPAFMLAPTAAPEPRPRRTALRYGLLIGAVVVAVLAVVITVQTLGSVAPGGQRPDPTDTAEEFAIDGCAKQDGPDARAIDCADAERGDYVITAEVETAEDCPDPTQPVITQDDGETVFCLKPYSP